MSESYLEGPVRFSYDWLRAALSHTLRHLNIYGDAKRHGLGTLFFLVCMLVSFQYAYVEYLDRSSAYLMALAPADDLSANVSCSALLCRFYQEAACDAPRLLSYGETTSIAVSQCQWTAMVVTNASFEAKRTALALLNTVQNETTREYFATVEQETLKFVSLSKTVDATYSPPAESWSVQVFSTYDYYAPCAAYHTSEQQTCGAFQFSFDNKVYTITVNREVGFVVVLSAGMLSSIVFYILIKLALYNFDAGSELHRWFGEHRD